MARKTPSRLELRKQAEAADKGDDSDKKPTKKKKATRKKATRRTKEKTPVRQRLVWGVFNASMKEEARFPYDQRSEAEKKIKQLAAKSSKPFFIQGIKEPLPDAPAEEE